MNFSDEEKFLSSDFFNETKFLNSSLLNVTSLVYDLEYCASDNSSKEDQENENVNILFNFVTYGILLNCVGIFGIFARCDTVLIITSVLLFGMPSIYSATGHLFIYYYRVYPVIAPVVFPIGMISQTVSVYLTLIVTLERFVAVCHPLQARSLCTCGRARLYVIVVIIFSVCYNITRFWEVDILECKHILYDVSIYRVYPSKLRNNTLYIKIYIHWMYLIFMYFIPFGFLSVLNTAIYRQVRKANQERQRLSRLQKKEIGLATMLLCVVVVFLICNLLALVSNVLEAFYGQTNDFLVETGNLMITINSSVNFVIYVIFGEKFKRLFFKLFFPHGLRFCGNAFGGRDSPEHIHEDSFMSCNGDRSYSIRQHLQRINTTYSKNNRSINVNPPGRKVQSTRIPRASSPGPCIYYPARESRGSWEQTSTTNF
ncbi:FMRFamide receptor isoform X2 [Planococcus citri]|uniref:FMRFamide receptor isoform X2 n=1 Tax=Planococcus citri TaxID=170843 RepID=UPI0031F84F06